MSSIASNGPAADASAARAALDLQPTFRPRLPHACRACWSSCPTSPTACWSDFGVSQDTASLIVGLVVTLSVGGPHMYSTYLRTALEPRFRERYGLIAYAPLRRHPDAGHPRIPLCVRAAPDSLLLLGVRPRHPSGAVHLGDLPFARRGSGACRSIAGSTARSFWDLSTRWRCTSSSTASSRSATSTLFFPDFLKRPGSRRPSRRALPLFFLFYVIRTLGEIRRGRVELAAPDLHGGDRGLAFVVPLFDNLDVAFQGFNTWHSLQYLALTWFILARKAERGEIGSDLVVQKLAGTHKTGAFYAAMVGATVVGGRGLFVLWKGLGIPAGQELLRRRPLFPPDSLLLRPHPLPGFRAVRARPRRRRHR